MMRRCSGTSSTTHVSSQTRGLGTDLTLLWEQDNEMEKLNGKLQRLRANQTEEDAKILMIHQLWLWKLSDSESYLHLLSLTTHKNTL